jgi:diaminopimelate epimerase
MKFDIIKCHGSGNDFPMIDARAIDLPDAAWATVARALADRAGPVGGDGLLLLGAADAAFAMRMFNSDGSEAETCLNGLRCVARLGFEALALDHAQVRLKTSSASVARAPDVAPGVYSVRETAGPVGLDTRAWPIIGAPARVVDAALPMLPGNRRFTALTIPNPHLISFVEKVDDAELSALGEICEAAPDWLPNRANVSFVEVRGGDLFVRTYERGVGLTDSCGSAMAASAHAACLTGRVPFAVPLTVFNRGGKVRAEAGEDGMVTLIGNATFEWRGSVAVDLETGAAGAVTVDERFGDDVAAWDAVLAGIGG